MSLFASIHFARPLDLLADELGLKVSHGADGLAIFGPDGEASQYRYVVTREIGGTGPPLPFCLINPSTADHRAPDPTLTRCVGFGRAVGASAILIVNPFAYRSKDVKRLAAADDPVGPRNREILRWVGDRARVGTYARPIVGWGPPTKIPRTLRPHLGAVLGYLAEVDCLALTKDGHPSHPLMLPSACRPVAWSPPC